MSAFEDQLTTWAGTQRELLAELHARFDEHFAGLDPDARASAALAIRRKVRSPKLREAREALVVQVLAGTVEPLDLEPGRPTPAEERPAAVPPRAGPPFPPLGTDDAEHLQALEHLVEHLRVVLEPTSLHLVESGPLPPELADAPEWLKRAGPWDAWNKVSGERFPAFCSRLSRPGSLQVFGGETVHRAAGDPWELPRDHAVFWLRYGSLTVVSDQDIRLRVLPPVAACLASDELPDDLEDHRYGQWGEDAAAYGLDRVVVVEDLGRYDGWAWDTRGTLRLRRLRSFDGDEGREMSVHWPEDPQRGPFGPPTFTAWLEGRIGELADL